MAKTVINNQGVITRGGSGTLIQNSVNISGATTINGAATVTGKGLNGVALSAATSLIATGATNTDISVTIPAGAVILDIGVIFTDAVVINSAADLAVDVGTSAGGAQYAAAVNMISNNTAAAAGSGISTSGLNGEGAVSLAFKANVPLRVVDEDIVHFRVANSANNITAGEAVAFVRYMVIPGSHLV
mgnify:FL=1